MSRSLRQALAIVQVDRAERRKPGRPRGKGRGGAAPEPEIEIAPPDPVHLLHHLAQQWPVDAIQRHQLTAEQADLLEEDLPGLLPALVDLAERHDVSTGIETDLRALEPERPALPVDALSTVAAAVEDAKHAGYNRDEILRAVYRCLDGDPATMVPVVAPAPEPKQDDLLDKQPAAFTLGHDCKQFATTLTAVAKRLGMSASRLNRELRNNTLATSDVRRLNIIMAEIEEAYLKTWPYGSPTQRLLAYRATQKAG